MLRHFSKLSRRMPNGFSKETVIMDTMSVLGGDFIFRGERDHQLALIRYLGISSLNRLNLRHLF